MISTGRVNIVRGTRALVHILIGRSTSTRVKPGNKATYYACLPTNAVMDVHNPSLSSYIGGLHVALGVAT